MGKNPQVIVINGVLQAPKGWRLLKPRAYLRPTDRVPCRYGWVACPATATVPCQAWRFGAAIRKVRAKKARR